MPLVRGYVINTVVYLYPSYEAAIRDLMGGTGFLVYVPFADSIDDTPRYNMAPVPLADATGHLYVVTNRHNIIDPDNLQPLDEPTVAVRTVANGLSLIPISASQWLTHQNGDDVALAPIDLSAQEHRGAAFPIKALLTREDIDTFQIGLGVDIYYTGRFQPSKDAASITALRRGSISAMPVNIAHPLFKVDVESYLIEGLSRSGFSGSPVVPGLQGHRYITEGASISLAFSDFLLGIHWGHLRDVQEGEIVPLGDIRVRLPEAIMAVAPSWRILDILNSEELVIQRQVIDRKEGRLTEQT